MKSNIWLIALMLAFSAPAFASNWANVSPAAPETVYVDRESIRHEGGLTRAVVLHNYSTVRTIGDTAFPHKSKVIEYSFRCDESSLGYSSWKMRSGEFGTGRTVWARQAESVTYFLAGNDPIYARLLNEVCG